MKIHGVIVFLFRGVIALPFWKMKMCNDTAVDAPSMALLARAAAGVFEASATPASFYAGGLMVLSYPKEILV